MLLRSQASESPSNFVFALFYLYFEIVIFVGFLAKSVELMTCTTGFEIVNLYRDFYFEIVRCLFNIVVISVNVRLT